MSNSQQQNLLQLAEQFADAVWPLIESWSDFAKQTTGGPLMSALDQIGLQLTYVQGSLPVKQHLQLIGNARKGLLTVDFYLKRALRRGLLDTVQADALRAQLKDLAQRLDQHTQTVVDATNKKIAEDKEKKSTSTQSGEEPSSVGAGESSTSH